MLLLHPLAASPKFCHHNAVVTGSVEKKEWDLLLKARTGETESRSLLLSASLLLMLRKLKQGKRLLQSTHGWGEGCGRHNNTCQVLNFSRGTLKVMLLLLSVAGVGPQ